MLAAVQNPVPYRLSSLTIPGLGDRESLSPGWPGSRPSQATHGCSAHPSFLPVVSTTATGLGHISCPNAQAGMTLRSSGTLWACRSGSQPRPTTCHQERRGTTAPGPCGRSPIWTAPSSERGPPRHPLLPEELLVCAGDAGRRRGDKTAWNEYLGVSICSQSPKDDAHTRESRGLLGPGQSLGNALASVRNCSDLPPANPSCLPILSPSRSQRDLLIK